MNRGLRFGGREVRDLLVAWLALGVAFTLFARPDIRGALQGGPVDLSAAGVGLDLLVSLLTVGAGFLLHELAHKVVAVRFGQLAEFRADYTWLFLAVMGGLVGFLFAAPGAVYHRGRISPRENGLIAAAGPVTNLVLGAGFAVLFVLVAVPTGPSVLAEVGYRGAAINFLLAGFNVLPFGPLDGKKVLDWHVGAFVALAVPSLALGAGALFLGF